MDFKDAILQIAEKIAKQKDTVATEEATKNAFIMPVINALGYDIFDPTEVVPELDCDLIKNKGEKIDYAIMKDGEPIMLIECKHCNQDLDLHSTQLQKYFVSSKARFGVLTNGIEYRFYTDIEKLNLMDEKPFLIFNMLELNDADIEQLKKFHKSYYNEKDIFSTANELKYSTEIKSIFQKDLSSPSPGLVEYFVRQVYSGRVGTSVIEQFTPIVKKSLLSVINDIISDRLTTAIKNNEEAENEKKQPEEVLPEGVVFIDKENGIITTQEEIDAFVIVKNILRQRYDVSQLGFKDCKNYFIIYNKNNLWWVCRIFIGTRTKNITLPNENYNGNYETINFTSLDEIYNLQEKLEAAMQVAVAAEARYNEKH